MVSLLLLLGLYETVVIRRGRNTLTTVCFDKLKADIIINLFGLVLRRGDDCSMPSASLCVHDVYSYPFCGYLAQP